MTTYTLDLLTVERFIVARLPRARMSIVTDSVGYQMAALAGPAARGAGTRYRVFNVFKPNFAFHPKVALLEKGGQFRLIVGSGNLTYSGICSNLEVIDHIDFRADEAPTLARQVQSFVGGLIGILDKREGVRTLQQYYDQLKPTREGLEREQSHEVQFLHSLETSLWNQLQQNLVNYKNAEIEVVSPFIDQRGEFIATITKELSARSLHFVGPQLNWKIGQQAKEVLATAKLSSPSVVTTQSRALHAKLINFCTDQGRLLISGSANATGAAWLGSFISGTGNAEAILVRSGGERNLLKEIELGPLVTEVIDEIPNVELGPSIQIIDCELVGANARITVEGEFQDSAKVEYWSSERTFVPGRLLDIGVRTQIDASVPECILESLAGTLVRVQLQSKDSAATVSNWAWLSSEELICSSSNERPVRQAVLKIFQGIGTYQDLFQLAAYLTNQMLDLHDEQPKSDLPSIDSRPLAAQAGADRQIHPVPASIDLSVHLISQGRRTADGGLGLVLNALKAILKDKKSIENMGDRSLRLVQSLHDQKEDDTGESPSRDEFDETIDFLKHIRTQALKVIDWLTEFEEPLERRVRLLETAMSFLLIVRTEGRRYVGKAEGRRRYDELFEPTDSVTIREYLLSETELFSHHDLLSKLPSLCELSIWWILATLTEHRSMPTGEMKHVIENCYKALSICEPLSKESHDRLSYLPEFPALEAYKSEIGKIIATKTTRERAEGPLKIYRLAACAAKSMPHAEFAGIDVVELRKQIEAFGLSSWSALYDKLATRPGPCVALIDPSKSESCPLCWMRIPTNKINSMRREPEHPVLCANCNRILIPIGEV